MNLTSTRRDFMRTSMLAGAIAALPAAALTAAPPHVASTGLPPVRLGLASYTFRNFTRTQ